MSGWVCPRVSRDIGPESRRGHLCLRVGDSVKLPQTDAMKGLVTNQWERKQSLGRETPAFPTPGPLSGLLHQGFPWEGCIYPGSQGAPTIPFAFLWEPWPWPPLASQCPSLQTEWENNPDQVGPRGGRVLRTSTPEGEFGKAAPARRRSGYR